jgi:hypothetical protein
VDWWLNSHLGNSYPFFHLRAPRSSAVQFSKVDALPPLFREIPSSPVIRSKNSGIIEKSADFKIQSTLKLRNRFPIYLLGQMIQRHLIDALDERNIPFRIDLHVWDQIPERFHEIIRNGDLALS